MSRWVVAVGVYGCTPRPEVKASERHLSLLTIDRFDHCFIRVELVFLALRLHCYLSFGLFQKSYLVFGNRVRTALFYQTADALAPLDDRCGVGGRDGGQDF